jgi:hypothetical protein
MSLSPLHRDGSHFEHRAELGRQQRADQQNLEAERQRHERDLQLRRGDLRRKEADLHEREDRLAEREGRLASREREASTANAETLAREIAGVDHAGVNLVMTAEQAATVRAVLAARERALAGCPPDVPSNPTARAAIAIYNKLTGLTDDTPKLSGTAAQMVEIARRQGLA